MSVNSNTSVGARTRDLIRLAWEALLFRHEAYVRHVARADTLKRGLTLLVAASLVAGILSFVVNFVSDLRPMSVAAQRQQAAQGIEEFLESLRTMRNYYDLPPGLEQEMVAYMKAGMEIGFRIEELPTRLPKPVGRLFTDLGAFLSLPFTRMAGWAGYAIWVLLVAKLLGGRATVAQQLGATALYAVPHVLDILGSVQCLGGMAGLVATVWGIAIYVKAVAVANEFSIGRAIVATVVPVLVGGTLALMGSLAMVLFLALASA
jgi:hypothetical protein